MPPRKKTDATEPVDLDQPKQRSSIKPLNPVAWNDLLAKARTLHWRRIRVVIQMNDLLMAGKPKSLDATKAMLKARGLEDQIEVVPLDDPEARKKAAEVVVDEGICEFHRREDKPGIWFPTNNIKAMLKENWSVIGARVEIRGSRGAMAEGLFVYSCVDDSAPPAEREWIYLADAPDGVDQSVTHSMTPRGPVSAIKRHEYLRQPTIEFEMSIAHAVSEKLPNEKIAEMLLHASAHGLGACRSQGRGTFTILQIADLDADGKLIETAVDAAA